MVKYAWKLWGGRYDDDRHSLSRVALVGTSSVPDGSGAHKVNIMFSCEIDTSCSR